MAAFLTNAHVYRCIAEEALAEMTRLDAAAKRPKPDRSPGFVIQLDPEHTSFKSALIAIAFSGIYLEALLFVHGTFRMGATWEEQFDRKPYEEKLKALSITDEMLLGSAKRLRKARRELVHEKARPLEAVDRSKIYWAQSEAREAVAFIQAIAAMLTNAG